MQWGQLLDIDASARDDERQDPEERLLAQMITVRMVTFLGKDTNLDNDEWRGLFSWLGLNIPKRAEDSHLYSDYAPALKRWWTKHTRHLDPQAPVNGTLTRLCDEVTDLLQLNPLESKLLMLTWLRLRHPIINPVLLTVEESRAKKLLALLTAHGSDDVHLSLQNNHRLKRLGLIATHKGDRPLLDLDDILSAGPLLRSLAPLVNHDVGLLSSAALRSFIADRLMGLCPIQEAGRFSLASFSAVPLRQLAVDYLQRAIDTQQTGANILIYGPPGVGKTELVKTLATRLKVPLYGVPVIDKDDDVLSPSKRLHRYQMVQKLINQRPGMVMFDEIEDVINDEDALPKGWMNQLLETNPKPGLWISNSVYWLDPAYLRRFDMIIEVKAQQGEQAHEHFQHLLQTLPVTPQGRQHLSRQRWMTPAAAEQLCRLGQLMNPRTPQRNELHLDTLMSHRLKALGQTAERPQPLAHNSGPQMPDYRLEWLNTRPGLEGIVQRLTRRQRGRLCLHGLPGSGKTALAKHLAKRLERELIVAHASSLLDKFVGGTEEKLAALFHQARQKNAVLLLDEVDTLLMQRDNGMQSWEISHTNELLVQIENFDGILLATTNRVESLDRAVMRRFDLKVEFLPLAPEPLRDLLKAVLPERDHARLATIPANHLASRRLTPGNVRTALDQLDLRGLPLRLNTLMDALTLEEREQHGQRQPMGFL